MQRGWRELVFTKAPETLWKIQQQEHILKWMFAVHIITFSPAYSITYLFTFTCRAVPWQNYFFVTSITPVKCRALLWWKWLHEIWEIFDQNIEIILMFSHIHKAFIKLIKNLYWAQLIFHTHESPSILQSLWPSGICRRWSVLWHSQAGPMRQRRTSKVNWQGALTSQIRACRPLCIWLSFTDAVRLSITFRCSTEGGREGER